MIASDFDNTLGSSAGVPLANQMAVRRWQQSGHLFGVVTGRGPSFTERLRPMGVWCDFGLCNNGAYLCDASLTPLRRVAIVEDVFRALEEAFSVRQKRLGDLLSFDRADLSAPDFGQYSARLATVEAASAFARELNDRFGADVIAYANGDNINIVRAGEGKARGVSEALKAFGLPRDAVAVVGDDYNDLDMIVAHHGWAVAHGRVEVVAAATHVCASVAELIDQLLDEEG